MDGVLLVDKPAGITSAEAVRQIKARVRPARVGHLGTLDPFATGLLPILIGEATKLAPFLQDGEKEYEGVIRLGLETDTLDRTGAEIQTAEVPPLTSGMLADAAARFTGRIAQQPPIFSAIKRDGVPLYRLARRGVEVEPPPPREVEISRLRLDAMDATSIHFVAACSTGTYMRSLARDIGTGARHGGPSGGTAPPAQWLLCAGAGAAIGGGARRARRGRVRRLQSRRAESGRTNWDARGARHDA